MDHMDNCIPDAIKPLCGSFRQTVRCKNCNHVTVKSEPFYSLTLQLGNNKKVENSERHVIFILNSSILFEDKESLVISFVCAREF